MTEHLGFDLHSKDTVYLGQEPSGNVTAQGKVSTTVKGICGLVKSLNLPKGTKIGLETGPQAMWVARLLSGLGMQPVVIDAREVRQKARRIGQKCDRRDAFEICDGLRRGIYTLDCVRAGTGDSTAAAGPLGEAVFRKGMHRPGQPRRQRGRWVWGRRLRH